MPGHVTLLEKHHAKNESSCLIYLECDILSVKTLNAMYVNAMLLSDRVGNIRFQVDDHCLLTVHVKPTKQSI